jgi:hypothetical protein
MFENIVLHGMWLLILLMGPADRNVLASSWDDHSSVQVERAFCATVHIAVYTNKDDKSDLSNGMAEAVVADGSVRPAIDLPDETGQKANAYEINPGCPNDDSTIVIHTHTPTTCGTYVPTDSTCVVGGADAYQCIPSDQDLVWTAQTRLLKIGGVQCDKNAIIMFSPVVKNPPPKAKNRSQKPVKRLNLGVIARQGPGYAWRLLNRQPSR